MDFKIKWIGSDNDYHYLRRGVKQYKPLVHVFHIMEGTLESTKSHFNNENVNASSNFGIGRDGEIHQYVAVENGAWTNGIVTNKDWYWNFMKCSPNYYTITYELEGFTGNIIPKEQYEALLYLVQLYSAMYSIPFEGDRLQGHFHIDPVNRQLCPGVSFPWQRLYEDLGVPSLNVVFKYHTLLKKGITGGEVNYLQRMFHYMQIECGPIDGVFGSKTHDAVEEFQKQSKILIDGIVGPVTWAKLYERKDLYVG